MLTQLTLTDLFNNQIFFPIEDGTNRDQAGNTEVTQQKLFVQYRDQF
jgi:hypothetical protein